MLFTGAKPVAPATKTIGRLDSRSTKSPSGPSKRIVAHLHLLEDVGGEAPARHQADLQFDVLGLCGALAKEKARRSPSSRMMLMYWPAA
jgi:hypothetical protein